MIKNNDNNFRKISRDFKRRIEFMNKIPKEDAINLFFEMCDINLMTYIKTERERFQNKSIKDIIISMHETREKIRGRKRNRCK